ncbi:MAG: DUF1588 domain-containing protein [Gemmataceae bacterium]
MEILRPKRTWLVAVSLLVLSSNGIAGEKPTRQPVAEPTFVAHVQPFLKAHCLQCHGPRRQRGDVAFHNIEVDFDDDESAALWQRVLEQVRFGQMPPKESPRPKSKDVGKVVLWIEGQLQKSGRYEAYARKLLRPEYGNYVNHEMLFSGEIKTPPYSPARLWRLSPEIYLANKRRGAKSPFVYPTAESEIRDYSATSQVDESTIKMIMVTVEKMIEEAIIDIKGRKLVRYNRKTKKNVVVKRPPVKDHRYAPFLQKEVPSNEQIQRVVDEEFRTIHSRLPTNTERNRYVDFLKANMKVGGNLEGMKAAVLALHLSPEAIFRMELGLGPQDKFGRRRLSEVEIAYALSYALTDSNPYRNRVISDALKEGKLKTKKGVQEVVRALLRTSATRGNNRGTGANPRIFRFFRQYFGYRHEVFKDDLRIRRELGVLVGTFSQQRLQNDLEVLIEDILRKDKNVLQQLLTTNEYYVAHPGPQTGGKRGKQKAPQGPTVPARRIDYIFMYNLPHLRPLGEARNKRWKWVKEQPIAFPEEQRAGVLTHPAWLTAFSTNFDNDPIHRGLWIRRKLLAGAVADVPPDVNAQVPEDPHKTLRERMEVVRPQSCWRCHEKINPLGETFEIYDDFGRYRTHHYFDKKKILVTRRDGAFFQMRKQNTLTKRSIDAKGYLSGTSDPKLDGPVKDAVDLMHRLAKSDRARQSFVRYVFRYFMGRNELLSDSQTLIEADRVYVQSSGSFNALVVSLLSSDSFLYRK